MRETLLKDSILPSFFQCNTNFRATVTYAETEKRGLVGDMLRKNLSYSKRINSFITQGKIVRPYLHSINFKELGLKSWRFFCKQVHCIVFKHGFDKDMILMTFLHDMYCKCIDIKEDAVFMMKCLKEML